MRKISARDFLGHKDVNWAPIFLDMLSKKLCELYVDNYNFPGYMSVQGADLLRQVTLTYTHVNFKMKLNNSNYL